MAQRSGEDGSPVPWWPADPGSPFARNGRWRLLLPIGLEGGRLAAEYASLVLDPIYRGAGVSQAEGVPVLLIPGFLAGDWTLATLGGWLRRLGYQPAYGGIALNAEPSEVLVTLLARRLLALASWHGRPVSIVGQSRGGLLGKVLADRHPAAVEQVVTLGSPLADPFDVHPLPIAAVRLAYVLNRPERRALAAEERFLRELAAPSRVRVISVYSRTDGVVHWRACLRSDVTVAEVSGSHMGMALNPAVYRLLAEVLAEERPAA